MNAFAISSLLILISCFLIGVFAYLKGKHDKAAIAFCLFSLSICFWGWGGYKIATATLKSEAFFWWQMACPGIISPVFYAHFIFALLKLNRKYLLCLIYFLTTIFLVFNFLFKEIFFGELKFLFNQFYWVYSDKPAQHLFLYLYILFYCILLPYSLYLVIKAQNKSTGFRRKQLKLLTIAGFLGWTGGHFNFLPYFGINVYPYANYFVVVYVLIIAYSIFRHKFLDIEVIIRKTLVFAGLFTIVYGIFAFFAFLGQVFFERFITQNRWLSMVPSVLVITVMLRPLETLLVSATDKYLFQKKYSYKELLKRFASEALSMLELNNLIKLTEEELSEIMRLDYCKVLITDNPDIKIEAAVKLPISAHDRTIGFLLLGRKKSDEEYTYDDLDVLRALAKTLAIAISNARFAEELKKVQIEMAEKDKMATIGTLAAGMAHEIRNPITTIRVFSEYVPDRLSDMEFQEKYRDVVTKEVDKIDHIIQTLIDFSGDDHADDMENVSIGEAIDELLSLIKCDKEVSNKVEFIKEIPLKIPGIRVNRKEFDEIVLNITENAVHAIGGKGKIIFRAEDKKEFIELDIIDTGCGMSKDTIEHIFSPFFTTRSRGFGLGLFVVKQLVNRNGGKISVESKLGKGTTFSLRFNRVLR